MWIDWSDMIYVRYFTPPDFLKFWNLLKQRTMCNIHPIRMGWMDFCGGWGYRDPQVPIKEVSNASMVSYVNIYVNNPCTDFIRDWLSVSKWIKVLMRHDVCSRHTWTSQTYLSFRQNICPKEKDELDIREGCKKIGPFRGRRESNFLLRFSMA